MSFTQAKRVGNPLAERFRTSRNDKASGNVALLIASLVNDLGNITGSVHVARNISELKRTERSLREGKDTYEIVHRVVRKATGEVRIVHEKCEHFRDEAGRIIRSVGMVHDITGRKRAEEKLRQRTAELEAANRELDAFSYSVSHDLRAPLRSIAGFSQILLEDYIDRLDDDGKDSLRRMHEASRRMSQLIDDLLNLSRVTRTEMNREKVNLSKLAAEIADTLSKTQPERKVKFIIAKGLFAYGDERLFDLMLENLLNNAFKFTEKQP